MWPPQPGQSCRAGCSTRSRSGRARANNLAISCLQKQSKHYSLNARASQLCRPRKKQGRHVPRHGADRGRGAGRGCGRGPLEPGSRNEEHRHRDRVRCGDAARCRDRRNDGCLVHRRARIGLRPKGVLRHRGRRDRAGAGVGLAPARLRVLVIEYLDRILPGMDNEVVRQFQRILKKQGFRFKLSSKVTKVEANGQGATVTVEPAAGGSPETIQANAVLVSIGRVPYTEGLGLEHVGVQKDNKGRILTDAHFATNVTGIYAIGDVIAGPMLAHKAEDEGVAVAEILAGRAGHVNYDVIPNVVYTAPEVASVGKTEEELKKDGVAYKAGKFPFTANGRAKVNRTTDGFVKILADATTDRVLGVHIVGPEAGNLVMECAVALEFGASSEDIARTCHAHPTLTEAVKEAALAVEKRAIHM